MNTQIMRSETLEPKVVLKVLAKDIFGMVELLRKGKDTTQLFYELPDMTKVIKGSDELMKSVRGEAEWEKEVRAGIAKNGTEYNKT